MIVYGGEDNWNSVLFERPTSQLERARVPIGLEEKKKVKRRLQKGALNFVSHFVLNELQIDVHIQ